MNRQSLEDFVEKHRVPNSEIVYNSKGVKESGHYTTSRAAEVASNLYLGMHRYHSKDGSLEIWAVGKLCLKL